MIPETAAITSMSRPALPSPAPRWEDLRSRWPNAGASRFVTVGGIAWHLQVAGAGPVLLLVHGTGSASFSWGAVLPLLARRFTVVAPDLPGHGFTTAPSDVHLTLPGMALALASLLRHQDLTPAFAAGHSAGAAVLLRMAVDRSLTPAGLAGLAPALVPPPAAYRLLFAPLVHRLATTGFVASSAAALAGRDRLVASLLDSTGSAVDPDRLRLYQEFFRSERHVHQVLTMMSVWSLTELVADLHRVPCPVTLLAGRRDYWVPLAPLRRLADRLPRHTFQEVEGGHLFHEDRAPLAARLIEEAAARVGLP